MLEPEVPVIAIDGPGGAGKGTVARAVARRLGWHLLDSGALYRLVGIAALADGVSLEDEAGLARIATTLDVRFDPWQGAEGEVYRRGRNVSADIRSETAGAAASRVAALPAVRAALITRQQAFRCPPGLVADGRDMGSCIFPDAGLKVFLTASVAERALRRYNQLKQKGIDVSLAALSRDMAERDQRDAQRPVAPLQRCADARMLDSTGLDIDEVVSRVLHWTVQAYPGLALPGGSVRSNDGPEC